MRLKKLIALAEKTDSFDEQTLQELQAVSEEYPYFQLARLAYTLSLLEQKDSRFKPELRQTAIRLSDRRKLFYLLESKDFPSRKMEGSGMLPDTHAPFERIDSFLDALPEESKSENHQQAILDDEKKRVIATTDYLSYLLSDVEEDTLDVNPMQHQDRIDRFISAEENNAFRFDLKDIPEEVLPQDNALEEETLEDSFFSETLARIYIKQRKYDKALKIIRELNLLYPEKNRYFADQIRFLEKLVHNTSKIK